MTDLKRRRTSNAESTKERTGSNSCAFRRATSDLGGRTRGSKIKVPKNGFISKL